MALDLKQWTLYQTVNYGVVTNSIRLFKEAMKNQIWKSFNKQTVQRFRKLILNKFNIRIYLFPKCNYTL